MSGFHQHIFIARSYIRSIAEIITYLKQNNVRWFHLWKHNNQKTFFEVCISFPTFICIHIRIVIIRFWRYLSLFLLFIFNKVYHLPATDNKENSIEYEITNTDCFVLFIIKSLLEICIFFFVVFAKLKIFGDKEANSHYMFNFRVCCIRGYKLAVTSKTMFLFLFYYWIYKLCCLWEKIH